MRLRFPWQRREATTARWKRFWAPAVLRLTRQGRSTIYMQTPLSLASRRGHAALVKLLLASGADLAKTDAAGYTPLMSVCIEGGPWRSGGAAHGLRSRYQPDFQRVVR